MVDRGEIITVCRQIGGMMEAGVDILRITRVLRAQTDNARLLHVYDTLDHDLTMGRSLAEAMANAPDVWSPFAVSLVQQGESRNDIAGAFMRIADFLQKEEELQDGAAQREAHASVAASHAPPPVVHVINAAEAPPARGSSPMTVIALDGLVDRLQTLGLRFLTVISGLLLTLAGVWFSVTQGWLEPRWINVTLCSVAALFIGGTGVWVQRRLDADRRNESRCSFCGQYSLAGARLERAPRFAGAAICARCAAIVANRYRQENDNGVPEGEITGESEPRPPGASQIGHSHSGSGAGSNGHTAPSPGASGKAAAAEPIHITVPAAAARPQAPARPGVSGPTGLHDAAAAGYGAAGYGAAAGADRVVGADGSRGRGAASNGAQPAEENYD